METISIEIKIDLYMRSGGGWAVEVSRILYSNIDSKGKRLSSVIENYEDEDGARERWHEIIDARVSKE